MTDVAAEPTTDELYERLRASADLRRAALAERDLLVRVLRDRGESLRRIGRDAGLSAQGVVEILSRNGRPTR